MILSQTTPQPCLQADAGRVLPVFENFPLAQSEFGVAAAMGLDVIDASCGHDAASGKASGDSRMANAKRIGWAIYAVGFVIWLFGYLSAGHTSIFHWDVATPWWISSFVPNLEAELGLALMFASVIPIYGRAVQGNLARLFAYVALLVFAAVILAWWGFLAWLIWHVI